MYLVTTSQMREIDKYTINNIKIPGIVLMENAGKKVYEFICNLSDTQTSLKNICILCGTGNNGGDGLVVARHLANNSYNVTIIIIGSPNQMTSDTENNFNIIKSLKIPTILINKQSDLKKIKNSINNCDLIIDALLGTGLSRNVEGLFASVIKIANNSSKKIISIDIPSGIDANSGKVYGVAIKAWHTVTLALPKRGLLLFPGKEYAGEVSVVEISIPYKNLPKKINTELLLWNEAKKLLPIRPQNAHKGAFGKILILAGSKGYIGAPILTSKSALKTGSGLVYLGYPECLHNTISKKIIEQIPFVLPETDKGTISKKALNLILQKIEENKINCLAIGPGLGIHPETAELILELINTVKIPIVLDADGINSIAGNISILKKSKSQIVITPHSGEFSRLIDKKVEEIENNRIEILENFIATYPIAIVLKGANSLIGYKNNIFMNLTGNSGMATAGSGDVLTGMIASLIGQGLNTFNAAKLAVFLHGKSGDLAGAKTNMISIIASDILNNIPYAINELLNYSNNKDNYKLGNLTDIPNFYKCI